MGTPYAHGVSPSKGALRKLSCDIPPSPRFFLCETVKALTFTTARDAASAPADRTDPAGQWARGRAHHRVTADRGTGQVPRARHTNPPV